MSSITPMKAGVVGCGAISDAYLRNLTARFRRLRVVACSDLDRRRAEEQAGKYHI